MSPEDAKKEKGDLGNEIAFILWWHRLKSVPLSPVGLRFETNVAAFHFYRKNYALRSDLRFQVFRALHYQAMKPGKGKVPRRFSATSFRFYQSVVDALNGANVVTHVGA